MIPAQQETSVVGRALLPQILRRQGEVWTVASAGKEVHLRDVRGLHYLATLLRAPGREIHVCELVRSATGTTPETRPTPDPSLRIVRGLGEPCARIDAKARAAYIARLRELAAEREDAERCYDRARLAGVERECEALVAELETASRRRATPDAERARVAVTKAIGTALEHIGAQHGELGAHLDATVRRGYYCAYRPDPRVPTAWET